MQALTFMSVQSPLSLMWNPGPVCQYLQTTTSEIIYFSWSVSHGDMHFQHHLTGGS